MPCCRSAMPLLHALVAPGQACTPTMCFLCNCRMYVKSEVPMSLSCRGLQLKASQSPFNSVMLRSAAEGQRTRFMKGTAQHSVLRKQANPHAPERFLIPDALSNSELHHDEVLASVRTDACTSGSTSCFELCSPVTRQNLVRIRASMEVDQSRFSDLWSALPRTSPFLQTAEGP